MKNKIDTYSIASEYLARIYDLINHDYFSSELEPVIITIQSSRRTYGHISINPVWTVSGQPLREINISSDYLYRPLENIVTTLVHECSHLWNMQHNIEDTSRSGTYHNKHFKETAEELGQLIIDYDSRIGWSVSSPSPETLDFCARHKLVPFDLYRCINVPDASDNTDAPASGDGQKKNPSSTRKYQCPSCGLSIRATREVDVTCTACQRRLERV